MFAVTQAELRAMVDRGSLPEPDWVQSGQHRERIYSLEWLALAAERVNAARLPGFDEDLIVPPDGVQITLRFDKEDWNVAEITATIAAVDSLWSACVRAAAADRWENIPPLTVRRMSAGSPLDLLMWVRDLGGVGLGIGGAASLLRYVLKHPESAFEALPRMAAAWHSGWAGVDAARLERLQSRAALDRFLAESEAAREQLGQRPPDVIASGAEVANLEAIAPLPPLNAPDEGAETGRIEASSSAHDDTGNDDVKRTP